MGLHGRHAWWSDLGDPRICRKSADALQSFYAKSVPDVCARVLLFLAALQATNSKLRYIVTLTIAPAFFAAAIYLCLGRIIVVFGDHVSRFKPRTYTLTFITADVLSLVFQAAGGALASAANDQANLDKGVNVMLAGLGLQVASLTLFIILAGEFAWRVLHTKHNLNPVYADLRASKVFKFFLLGKSPPN